MPNTDWGKDIMAGELDLPEAVFLSETTTIGELLSKFCEHGFAQFPVKKADGSLAGVVTKSTLMNQLVKQRVQYSDSVMKIVAPFDLRNVSNSVTLNELGRILTRNKFALVDGHKFVTTSDLLKKLCGGDIAQSAVQPQNKPASSTDDGTAGSMMTKIGLAAAATGLAATCAVLFSQTKK